MTIAPDSTAIAWFDELGKESVSVAGGKGANLGELTGAGFSVSSRSTASEKPLTSSVDVGPGNDEHR